MNRTIIVTLCLFTVLQSGFITIRSILKVQLEEVYEHATNFYPTDKINALLLVLKSDGQSLDAKNKAVWALGKSRASEVVPELRKFISKLPCNHDSAICQYELTKAIETLEGKSIDLFTFNP